MLQEARCKGKAITQKWSIKSVAAWTLTNLPNTTK